jgi:hypothetical protein
LTKQEKIALFKKREQPAAMRKGAATARADVVPTFLNGRKLRDYQRESLKWMMANFRHQKNCILGDEMVRKFPACLPSLQGNAWPLQQSWSVHTLILATKQRLCLLCVRYFHLSFFFLIVLLGLACIVMVLMAP